MSVLSFKLDRMKAIFLICALTLIAYCNIYSNEFLWDDEFLIEENSYITSFDNLQKIFSSSSTAGFGTSDSFFRPLQILAYTVAYSIGGHTETTNEDGLLVQHKRVWVFHALNVLLHLSCATLFFLLITALFGNLELAFVAALLWAIHPAHTEAITYMSGTADPLSVLLVLAASLFYYKFKSQQKFRWVFYGLATVCFALALLAKEAIIILPGLIMIIDIIMTTKRWQPKIYLSTIPFWLMAGIYMYLRQTVLNFANTYEFYDRANIYTEHMHYRAYTFLATLPEYFKILLYPVNLHMERRFPVFIELTSGPVIGGLVIVLAGLALLLWQRRHEKPIGAFAFLWFFIAFVPMCGILIPVNAFLLEHWLYLPSLGFFVLVAQGLTRFHRRPSRARFLPLTVVVALLMAATLHRNRDWRDPLTFYNNILKYNDGSARVHNNLAMAYAEVKEFPKAAEHYRLAIVKSDDTYPQPHYNLARIYIRQGDFAKAQWHLQRSLAISPQFHFAKNLLEQVDAILKSQSLRRE